MTIIIDGRKMRGGVLEKIKEEIKKLSFQPVFCDVLVGSDPASRQYVDMKAKTAEKVGMKFHSAHFPGDISSESLIAEIKKLKDVPNICGVIVQLPLPEKFAEHKREILDAVPEDLDVDCLGTSASEKFYRGENEIGFPTALACMAILDSLAHESVRVPLTPKKGQGSPLHPSWPPEWKNIVVLGQGELVGRPVAALVRARGIEPVTVRSNTEKKEEIIKEADVIISGIGRGRFVTGEMVKEGVVLIDAGTSESTDRPTGQAGNIVGDVDLDSVTGVASFVSPVPGGVGPMTVAMLLNNVLKVAKKIAGEVENNLAKKAAHKKHE